MYVYINGELRGSFTALESFNLHSSAIKDWQKLIISNERDFVNFID